MFSNIFLIFDAKEKISWSHLRLSSCKSKKRWHPDRKTQQIKGQTRGELEKPLILKQSTQWKEPHLGMLRVKGRPGSTRDPWPVTKEGILTRPDPARGFFEAFLTRPDPARKILDLTRPDPAREKSQRPARPVMVFSSTRPTRDFFYPDPFDPWIFSVCNNDLTLQNIHTNVVWDPNRYYLSIK